MVRVKICCISSSEEARLAVEYGASALGLVSEMPSGPGVINEETIADIVETVPAGIDTFLLTSRRHVETIVAQQRRTRASTLQLVDALPPGALVELRDRLPGVSVIQVVHVRGPESVDRAVSLADHVDGILLDSGNPDLAVKELGGTGRTHDWTVSRAIVDAVSCPVYLAGGLDADNVRAAIEAVGPFGIDVCSGVRTAGALDETRLEHFMDATRG